MLWCEWKCTRSFLQIGLQKTFNSNLSLFLISKISYKGEELLVSISCVNFMEGSIWFSLSVIFVKYLYHTSSLMHRDGSSVMFPLGSRRGGGFGSCNIRPSHPNDPVGIDLTPTPIPAAKLRIHTRQMTWLYPWVSLLILQQPIRAKLLWWLLNLSFKNRVATLFLLSSRDDVVIRLFVQSGIWGGWGFS